jgi:hypothetical protein
MRQTMPLVYTWLEPATHITQPSQSVLFLRMPILPTQGPKTKKAGGREVGMMQQKDLDRSQVLQPSRRRPAVDCIPKSTRWEWILVFVNLPGIAFFLYFASWVWAPPGQAGLYYDAGDSIAWTLLAFPFLLVCNLINLVLSRTVFARAVLYHDWRPLIVLLTAIIIWFSAFKYDSGRHFDGSRMTSQELSNPSHPLSSPQ